MMNTEKIKRNILTAAVISLPLMGIFTACDDIDENDRYIPVERPTVARMVLVQDFTGMRCINCPTAAETLHNVQEKYPGGVAVVGIHAAAAQDFTLPIGGVDLRAPVSDVYYNYYKVVSLPMAVVDGVASDKKSPEWPSLIDAQISKTAPADIHLTPSYDATTRELTVDYAVVYNEMYAGSISILLWVVENGIVGPQMNGSGIIPKYTHNHVLRASMNGDWGEELGSGFVTEQKVEGKATLKLDDKWVAENCQVVGFIFQTDSRITEQCAVTDVIPQEGE